MQIIINQEKAKGCTACEAICPALFEVREGICMVREGVDITKHERCAYEASEMCPEGAIRVIKANPLYSS